MTAASWRRVSATRPCPVCGKPDWCTVSADAAVVLCQRVESSRRIGKGGEAGWLHRLDSAISQRPYGRRLRARKLVAANNQQGDFELLAGRYQSQVDLHQLQRLATCLGLSVYSLRRLGIGWSSEHRAWSFPMKDSSGNVLGIRLRKPNGFKFAVKGSHEGLFIPCGLELADTSEPLLVAEGPTDTVALLDIGFANVVGRPSCTGGITLLIELVRCRRRPSVVIASDGDHPGRRGADRLASVLRAYAPVVQVIRPPDGLKDARAWLQAGGSRNDVEQRIQQAPVQRGVICARATAREGG